MRHPYTLPFAWIMGVDTTAAIMVLALTIPLFVDRLPSIVQKTYFTEVVLASRKGQIALIEQQTMQTDSTTPYTEKIDGRYTLSTQLSGNIYTINGKYPENNQPFSLFLTPLMVSNEPAEPTGSIQWLYGYNGRLLHEKSPPFPF